MKALVTGGGGFLGRYIVKALLARGDAVRVIGRGRYPDLAAQGVECLPVDLGDAAGVIEACEGRDTVFHVAAKAGYWGPAAEYERTNVRGTRNVLEGCRRHGVSKLVYTSTPSVVAHPGPLENVNEDHPYPDESLCEYQRTKIVAEREVLAASGHEGLATVSLRPHIIWGPGDPHFVPRIAERSRAGLLRQVGDGTNRVDVIYVENAAEAHLQAADRLAPDAPLAGKAYFLSQGEPVVLWSFVGRLLECLGLPPITRRISFRRAWMIGSAMEAAYRWLPLAGEPRLTRYVVVQLGMSHHFDISRARRDLDYTPRISIDEGLELLARHHSQSK